MKEKESEYTPPVLVRCVPCQINSKPGFYLLTETYPCKLLGYKPNQHHVFEETMENIYVCETHYKEFIHAKKN